MDHTFIEDYYLDSNVIPGGVEKPASRKIQHAPLSSEPRAVPVRRAKQRGKRKIRRATNDQSLGSVSEKDGDVTEDEYEEQTYSPLSLLFLDEESMQIWQEFLDLPEEEQTKLLTSGRKTMHRVDSVGSGDLSSASSDVDFLIVDASDVKTEDKRAFHPALDANESFGKMSSYTRSAARHAPLGVMLYLEYCVRSSICTDSAAVHIQYCSSSYERLLLHAVAQYLQLSCRSYDDETGNRVSEVENPWRDFKPPVLLLAEFIEANCR